MYPVSSTWESLMGTEEHYFQSKVDIAGVTYPQDTIMGMSSSYRAFKEEHPSVGACLSAELELKMLRPTVDIPRMALVEPYVRITEHYPAGESTTRTGGLVTLTAVPQTAVDALTVSFSPVQSGSGDPSPTNIRPISGWTEAVVKKSGANLVGGLDFAQIFSTCVGYSLDTDAKTFTFTRSSTSAIYPFPFKASTQYSFVFTYTGGRNTCARINYTDGSTSTTIALEAASQKTTVVITSSAGKTIRSISVEWFVANQATVYYEESGIFEGVITAADFEPYTLQSVTVDLSGTRYGGTVNLLTGEMTIDKYGLDGGSIRWSRIDGNSYRTHQAYSETDPLAKYSAWDKNIICSCYKSAANSSGATADGDNYVWLRGSETNNTICVKDTSKASLTGEQFQEAMTGVTFVYVLAEPITVQLTPAQLALITGTNNIWSNTGSISITTQDRARVSEWIPQGKFYIDTREYSRNDDDLNIMTLHCYDAMLKTEDFYPDSNLTYPTDATNVVQLIADTIGVTVDDRTWEIMQDYAYNISLPADYTMREVLSYIAAMFAGNFVMTYDGELLLITINSMPEETSYLVDNYGFAITFGGDRILV